MLRLTDLNPRRYRASQSVAQSEIVPGITFDCPCCIGTERGICLAVQVDPPFDPLHQIEEWQVDPAALYVAGRTIWKRTGDTWETLTLTPSIYVSQPGHWHGFITKRRNQMMIAGRNIDDAAKCVADMSNEDLLLFAQREPDLFRHVALGYRVAKLRPPTDKQIKHMVDRFLGWKLPENFNPGGGISFKKTFNEHHPMKHEPTGTNLLDGG